LLNYFNVRWPRALPTPNEDPDLISYSDQ
jgi:hypothetical protein